MSSDLNSTPRSGRARSGELEIAYEDWGNPEDPALLIVPGLGAQMVLWDVPLIEMLIGHRLRVIRMDNRDCGLSDMLDHLGTPGLIPMLLGIPHSLRYSLVDMAADAIAVLDHLEIGRAHIAGYSMGGMIAQTMAITWPERIRSLCSIMSRTGGRGDSLPGFRQLISLMRTAPTDLDGYLRNAEQLSEVIGSNVYPPDRERLRQLATIAFERGIHPAGSARQFHAINCQPNRARALGRIDIPALVIHGAADRLVFPRGGRHTAASIPNARLRVYEGMAHDLPEQLWPQFAAEIAVNAGRAA